MMTFVPDYGLTAITFSALAPLCLPFLRRPPGYLALSAVVAAVTYQQSIFGYVLLILLLYVFARAVERTIAPAAAIRLSRWLWACAGMLALLGLFTAGRLHLLDRVEVRVFNMSWTLPNNDMWLLLRMVSFLWEFGAGHVKELSLISYATWITLPFCLQGPLIRYSEYLPQSLETTPQEASFNKNWWRKLGLATTQTAIGIVLNHLTGPLNQSRMRSLKFVVIFGTGPWGFFMESAGGLHLMECFALLWGIQLPPSYNKPFGQPNISEFWARWNMTVTRVCRDYLFYNRWGFRRVNVYLNLMLVFLAVGLWHDTNWYWATWGLLHGTGFCVYLWYRAHRQRLTFIAEVCPVKVREITSRALTYIFVCLCWYVANKITLFLLSRHLPYHLH
jgi:D-alanyl-lipoteichoic acid acyltransferase DltB (MBOAT superfamily)